ncbi:MAG: deoxyribose-phosphate aldolase [Algicola sp.]|nr:deoxyribose-phosphate aldolase [Algicola sp.]
MNSPKAVEVINESIKVSGSKKLSNANITFRFRKKNYTANRNSGQFVLESSFIDSTEGHTTEVRDVLNNNGFKRFLNGKEVELGTSEKSRFSASVNSVHYFSVLPYGLDGEAVYKMIEDAVTINNKSYFTVKVSFDEEGGGEDYDDIFIYWINADTYVIDYLAYSYNEPKGKGIRFREAYNERYINEIRFVDYNNYKPKTKSVELLELPKLFENGQLELLSKIELEHVTVN